MAEKEEKPIEFDLEKIKKRRITLTGTTLGVLMALAGGTWLAHGWLNEHVTANLDNVFQSEVQAQGLSTEVRNAAQAAEAAAKAAESVGRNLDSFIKRQDVKEARERLNILKQQLGETQLWEASNGGENSVSRARKADLSSQIEVTTAYIGCLDAGRSDCSL